MGDKKGYVPFISIEAESIPEAHYRAIKAVCERGIELRTQYDRKNNNGEFIDPPGRDAKVAIRVENTFAEPRFPSSSWCERGKYIAELLGAKDHLVVPYDELKSMIKEGAEFSATNWPYAYHQRLSKYPTEDGELDQLEIILNKLAKDPLTRRAVAITPLPQIDLFMAEDQPCLREISLRAMEDGDNGYVLNMDAFWRSRDLFKAWPDNMIGVSNLHRQLAERLSDKLDAPVSVGPYTEFNSSLHIYGQDFGDKGAGDFLSIFPTEEDYIARAIPGNMMGQMLIIDELKTLREESTWKFNPEQIKIIDDLILGFENGKTP